MVRRMRLVKGSFDVRSPFRLSGRSTRANLAQPTEVQLAAQRGWSLLSLLCVFRRRGALVLLLFVNRWSVHRLGRRLGLKIRFWRAHAPRHIRESGRMTGSSAGPRGFGF